MQSVKQCIEATGMIICWVCVPYLFVEHCSLFCDTLPNFPTAAIQAELLKCAWVLLFSAWYFQLRAHIALFSCVVHALRCANACVAGFVYTIAAS